MPAPQDWLDEILEAAEALLADKSLNHQQVTFIEVIRSNANHFLELLDDMPKSQAALYQIIIPSHEINTPPSTIIGYSLMLLEYPEQFGVEEISEFQKQKLKLIHDNGFKVRKWTQSIYDSAQREREKLYDAPAQTTNLNQFLEDYVPLYQYFLKEKPVSLSAEIPKILPFVMINPYHLSHFLKHIILTIASELINEGAIQLSAAVEGRFVVIQIASEALHLTEETIFTLLEKQGRHVYRERLEAQGGKVKIQGESQIGLYLIRS